VAAPSFLAVVAAIAALALPGAVAAQTAPSNPARAALAALDRQADALFAAAAKRDWTEHRSRITKVIFRVQAGGEILPLPLPRPIRLERGSG
jgi:hypothetical protein